MKSTKIVSALLVAGLVGVWAVSASYHGEERDEMKSEYKNEMWEMKKSHKSKIKWSNDEMKAKMEKMEETMKPYFDALPQETQDKLNELKAEKKAKMEEKKEKYEEMKEKMEAMSDEEKKEHKEDMKEEREERKEEMKNWMKGHFEKVKEIVWDDTPEAKAFLEKAKELHSWMKEGKKEKKWEMKKERGEYKEARTEKKEEYKEKKFELRMKYKKAFAEKLTTRLDKISDVKLETIVVKIDAMIEKFESNDKLSEDKKEKLLAQLGGLKDVINEKLDKTSSEIDVEALLQ